MGDKPFPQGEINKLWSDFHLGNSCGRTTYVILAGKELAGRLKVAVVHLSPPAAERRLQAEEGLQLACGQ